MADERLSENLERITREATLTRGLGRSYGDASLPHASGARIANSVLANRLISFNLETGALRAEAGLSLQSLKEIFLPRGWFTPVTPGTQFVTLGGMVASDVHGKNQHVEGDFGHHVRWIRLRLGSGEIVECSETVEPELFFATIGGMGLTGHILEVEIQMQRVESPWIWQRRERIHDVAITLRRLREAGEQWPFTVAWLDLLADGRDFGRGALMCGRWATRAEATKPLSLQVKRRAVPVDVPGIVLNRRAMRLFNAVQFKWSQRDSEGLEHPETFFYPLDKLLDWNRMYGKWGFIQHQAVIPCDESIEPALRYFDLIRTLEVPVYLCVLKDCAHEGRGTISFPLQGYTFALDLPFRPDATQRAVDRLNEFVIENGGRIYLTKDGHTRAEHLRAMDPRLDGFNELRRRWDPEGRIRSALSVRLLGDTP